MLTCNMKCFSYYELGFKKTLQVISLWDQSILLLLFFHLLVSSVFLCQGPALSPERVLLPPRLAHHKLWLHPLCSHPIHSARFLHHSRPSHMLLPGHLEPYCSLPYIITLALIFFALGLCEEMTAHHQALEFVSDQLPWRQMGQVYESREETLGGRGRAVKASMMKCSLRDYKFLLLSY